MTIFADELENAIKRSIVYFTGLSDEDRANILASPTDLAQPHRKGPHALWAAIASSMAAHDKSRVASSLVDLGLDRAGVATPVTALVGKATTPLHAPKAAMLSVGDDFSIK